MKVYIILKEGKLGDVCYTSLEGVCGEGGVSYDSALRGKRKWIVGGFFVEIKELDVEKIRGRGKK
jgi:hypothetical protein